MSILIPQPFQCSPFRTFEIVKRNQFNTRNRSKLDQAKSHSENPIVATNLPSPAQIDAPESLGPDGEVSLLLLQRASDIQATNTNKRTTTSATMTLKNESSNTEHHWFKRIHMLNSI
ncbi:Uncharacterized protein Fot_13356 [Forsythia ovata]|uniref:Uncharacterized protein n=1 Tax=Forsythia ovata TaxID=205694 RepID=A0ABD1W386_9LAMI